jgi:hypothetical protein
VSLTCVRKKLECALPHSLFLQVSLMNIMGRHVLRLMGIGAVAIAIPQLASAFDSGNVAAFKLAMGPTSATQKNQSPPTASDNAGTKCIPSEGTCPKSHHRSKRRSKGSAAQARAAHGRRSNA